MRGEFYLDMKMHGFGGLERVPTVREYGPLSAYQNFPHLIKLEKSVLQPKVTARLRGVFK